jgi:hypothetical protein
LIDNIKWSTYPDEKPSATKKFIENELANGSAEFSSNPIRRYLEYILKDICFNLEAQVKFRF